MNTDGSSIPQALLERLPAGVDPGDVVYQARYDLDLEQRFTAGALVLTHDRLIRVSLENGEEPVCYSLSDADEIRSESLVSSGLVLIRHDEHYSVVCRYSQAETKHFATLAKVAEKVRKGEEITSEDTEETEEERYCPTCGRRYPDPDRPVCPKCLDKRSVFFRLLGFFKPHIGVLSLVLIAMLLQSATELFAPYLNGRIFFDEVLDPAGRFHGAIVPVLLLMVGVRLFAAGVSVAYGRMLAKISPAVIFSLKTELFSALQRLSMRFFSLKSTGALMNRVNYDALMLEFFFVEGMPFLLVNMLVVVGVAVMMLVLNWKLALLVFIPAPILLILTKRLIPKVWRLYSRRYRRRRTLSSVANDSLSGVRVVKAFGREEAEISRFGTANVGLFSANLSAERFSTTVFPLFHLIMQIGGIIVWAVGGRHAATGLISLGTLMTFVGYLGLFFRPLQFFTRILDWWSMCMNSAQRIFEVLDSRPDIVDHPRAQALPAMRGDVRVDHVTFAYEPNKPVIHDLSLEIGAGTMIGLVGHTGAGKSTITNLITRLYDVDEGHIAIDGIDVRRIRLDDLRRHIGIVLQTTYLFDGTVAENIAYARPDADSDEIIDAARAAFAHDFICRLPDGYDTRLGRNGYTLSGGEQQRVSIARAILKNPRILIFDEATSSVDTKTEEQIQLAIGRLVEGRTTIAIAHRLSTLRRADRLFVIEKGRIVEDGTHGELMRIDGKYHELVTRERKALKVIGVVE